MEIKENKKNKRISIAQIIIFILAGAVFLFSAYMLLSHLNENKESTDSFDSLSSIAVSVIDVPKEESSVTATLPTEASPEITTSDVTEIVGGSAVPEPIPVNPPDPNFIPISVDFDYLKSQNPDIVAWIYCAGTNINYPILQAEDNEYYIDRLVNGSKNPSGSIFMDFRNNNDLSDMNTLIYGHNMANSTMFSSLVYYIYESYYQSHPFLWIFTEENVFRVDVFAAYITDSYSDAYTIFNDHKIFSDFIIDSVSKSNFASNISPDKIENIVTLSTCSNRDDSERFVVLGNLVPMS